MSLLIVFTTCPNAETAEQLARLLVEQKAAACVNILPAVRSIYYWQGQIEQDDELLLIIKTDQEHWPDLESLIQKHHPYEVPEIIAVPADQVSPAYRKWLQDYLN